MGCGSSRHDVGRVDVDDDLCNTRLAKHLSTILGIKAKSPDIVQYVAWLRSEGCDAPEDIDDLTIEELADEPFNFKRLHLKKVRPLGVLTGRRWLVYISERFDDLFFFGIRGKENDMLILQLCHIYTYTCTCTHTHAIGDSVAQEAGQWA